jgi:hypothetical protein
MPFIERKLYIDEFFKNKRFDTIQDYIFEKQQMYTITD